MNYCTVDDTFQILSQLPKGNLLEFGVYSGNCLNRLINAAEEAKNPFLNVWGFDSFEGLPKETDGILQNPEWKEGVFSSLVHFNVETVPEAIELVRKNINRKNINLIPGFFEQSLTHDIGRKLANSASYIHIDVDLHSSTIECLDFLFQCRIPKMGSVIRYDDWIWTGYHCPEYMGGNSLAHMQIQEKYNIEFNRLAMNLYQIIKY